MESNSECNRHVYLSSTLANSQIHTQLEIYHTRKHVARLRIRPRRAREAIMRIHIPSDYVR